MDFASLMLAVREQIARSFAIPAHLLNAPDVPASRTLAAMHEEFYRRRVMRIARVETLAAMRRRKLKVRRPRGLSRRFNQRTDRKNYPPKRWRWWRKMRKLGGTVEGKRKHWDRYWCCRPEFVTDEEFEREIKILEWMATLDDDEEDWEDSEE